MKTSFLSRTTTLITLLLLIFTMSTYAQKYVYDDSWSDAGLKLEQADVKSLELTYSMEEFSLVDFDLKGEAMQTIMIRESFLPNNEGAPNLPGISRFIAVPNGAEVNYTVTAERVEIFSNVNIAPSPRIPFENDNSPMLYEKDMKLYASDAFYPAEAVSMSEITSIRGMNAVILGITPFQYNPVTKELKVYRDLKVEVSFAGGDGSFGEDRLRSPWFEPILSDMMINYGSMPKADYPQYDPELGSPDFEYVIITPDDPIFISYAEELALFRNMQGIRTGIFTTTEVGGNTTSAIESFVNDAYANWAIPPVAFLLLGDYGDAGNTIISPIWNSYCASDNIYADVSGNDLPDVIFARMTAQNETHLEIMISKVINYETDPPTDPDFFNHPITALGWQTERWFQICSETVGGYFKEVHGKSPVRINEIYSGTPGSSWSSNQNTSMVVDYFGPDGLGYIPATPAELGGWSGGNAQDVINALNDGAFLLQHRDHGSTTGWGEPDFQSSDISSLTNTDLSFIFSINCLTGKYNMSGECFAEKFHRYTYGGENAGAFGLIAASEVSYSFVNDTYVWGLFDNMWPDFMPDYDTEPAPRGLLPAFGNASGKYFLEQSNWPYNPSNKVHTHHLFHHHGCAFSTLYSEVPMNLTVLHDNVLLAGITGFNITADDGALIALSVDGDIIGTGMGTGSQITIPIEAQQPPTFVDVVVTKTNYYRYHAQVEVIPPAGPYIIQNDVTINDAAGNNNGQMDYGEAILLSLEVKNVGVEDGENVEVSVTTDDAYITMTNSQASYGTVLAGETKTIVDGFALDVANDIPDLHTAHFNVSATSGTDVWESSFTLKGHSVALTYVQVIVDDASGNGNGKLDPGETANLNIYVGNTDSADAYEVMGDLTCPDPTLTINTASQNYGEIAAAAEVMQSFSVTPDLVTPPGTVMEFTIDIEAQTGFTAQGLFSLSVGQKPILIIDLDISPHNSGPHMFAAIEELGIGVDYTTSWPDNAELYNTIFVCLGIYSYNHTLSPSEGTELAAFLNAGGNLYMEGGDTWFYDDPTAVHPMFNISGVADGSDDVDVLSGQAGTFTEGMSFNYAGDNNYMDHINATAPAFIIFENNSPAFFSGVAHDAGTYKTIGCAFEFGGLANGAGISTRVQLMDEYLTFFGIKKVTDRPAMPEGDEQVCQNSGDITYTTTAVAGADMYFWSIEPDYAGSVTGAGTEVTIAWSDMHLGAAYVRVCGMNSIGVGPTSDSLIVMIMESPTAVMSGTEFVCEGGQANLSVNLTGVAPWQLVINSEPYTANSSPFTFSVSPTANTVYSVSSVSDAGGCMNVGEGSTEVTLLDLPGQAATPEGPNSVNTGDTPTTVYTTSGAGDAIDYTWEISPADVYSNMEMNGMECTVTWAGYYTGPSTINVKVRGTNPCGDGPFSETYSVEIENVGISELAKELGLSIYPNPNAGSFTLEIATSKVDKVNLRIMNATGHLVYEEQDMQVNNSFSKNIDISSEAEGIYMVLIESDLGLYTGKIILQK